MGVTRIDDLPERGVVRAVTTAREASRERKGSAQRVSGANLSFFASESSLTYDWSGRLNAVSAYPGEGYAGFTITLESTTAVVPLTDLAITVYYSTNGSTWSEYPYAQGIMDYYNGVPPAMTRFLEPLQGAEVEPHASQYSFLLYGTHNTWAAFKVQAFGSDEVSINVVRTV